MAADPVRVGLGRRSPACVLSRSSRSGLASEPLEPGTARPQPSPPAGDSAAEPAVAASGVAILTPTRPCPSWRNPEMTDDETNRRRRLAALIGGSALVVAAGVAIVLAVTGHVERRRPGDQPVDLRLLVADATPTRRRPRRRRRPWPPRRARRPRRRTLRSRSPVPVPPIDSRPPVVAPPDQVVDVGGVHVTLTGLTNVTTRARVRGRSPDPASRSRSRSRTPGSEARSDLSALTVNVYQGADGIPLATVTSDQDNRPVPDSRRAGRDGDRDLPVRLRRLRRPGLRGRHRRLP